MFNKKVDPTSVQTELAARKELEKLKRRELMGKTLSMFGKVIPKGIRNPDDTIRNRHLYLPGGSSSSHPKTRLF